MRRKSQRIDPTAHFSSWAYQIRPPLRQALGVTIRTYVDREKTKKARQAAKTKGYDQKKLARIAIHYNAPAITNPPEYDFQEGDIFHPTNENSGLPTIQIGPVRERIEVLLFSENTYTEAHHLTADQLAAWLESGITPSGTAIPRSQTYSEITRYLLF